MTTGISPKVYVPAVLQLVAGAALVVLGVLLPDDTLRTLGYGVAAAAVAAFAAYRADPGEVPSTFIPGGVNEQQLDQTEQEA